MENKSTTKRSSAIIVHPFEIVRLGIESLLTKYNHEVILTTDSIQSLKNESFNYTADVILIYYEEYQPGGIIKQIINNTGANVILLGSSCIYHKDSFDKITEQITEGVTGFLDVGESINSFLTELSAVASGDIVISKKFVRNIVEKSNIVGVKLDYKLNSQETKILGLLSLGNTNKEIGKELFISEHTVKVHLRQLLNKLNLKNRQQAIAYAIRNSLVDEVFNIKK